MTLFSEPNNIAIIIQLAVAPVFLLAGIAGFLAVMSGRLGRIIDRERVISRRLAKLADPTTVLESHQEHHVLMKRAFITNRAIGLCTYSALTVCTLITALFIDDILIRDVYKLEIEMNTSIGVHGKNNENNQIRNTIGHPGANCIEKENTMHTK